MGRCCTIAGFPTEKTVRGEGELGTTTRTGSRTHHVLATPELRNDDKPPILAAHQVAAPHGDATCGFLQGKIHQTKC